MNVGELKKELEKYCDDTEVKVIRKIHPPARREQLILCPVVCVCSEFTDLGHNVRYTQNEVHSHKVDMDDLGAVCAIWL